MKSMGQMLREAQKLQARMIQLQEELAARTIEGTAGGGMVRAVANGRQEILSLRIEPEVVDPQDVEMLQDLVLAAVNDALGRSREMAAAEMGKVTGGVSLPGMM